MAVDAVIWLDEFNISELVLYVPIGEIGDLS